MYQKRADIVSQINDMGKQIGDLDKKNQELKVGISQFSDEKYLEESAREKLGLKKPGEEVVVVLPPPETKKEIPAEKKSFWQAFLEKLGF